MTAASTVNSARAFQERFEDAGVGFLYPRLEALGWKTYGDFAYASAYVPGASPTDEAFRKDVLDKIVLDTDDPKSNVSGHLRRIHWEAYVMVQAAMKASIERRSEEGPAKLDSYERDDRRKNFEAQHARGSLYWKKERVPSDDLIDIFAEMVEARRVEFVPWEERTDQEFMLANRPRPSKQRKLPGFELDAKGGMKFYEKDVAPVSELHECDVDFTHKWERMMERTGAAAEIGGVMSFLVHENIRDFLHDAKLRKPASEEFRPLTWEQVHNAEKEIWRQLAEKVGKDRKRGSGPPPADRFVDAILTSKQVDQILANAQVVHGAARARPGNPAPKKQPKRSDSPTKQELQRRLEQSRRDRESNKALQSKKRELADKQRTNAATKKARIEADKQAAAASAAASSSTADGGAGGGKAEGKGGKKLRGAKMPKALVGCLSYCPPKSGPICFGFNLPEGCDKARPGERCPRGFHVCCAKQCNFAAHSYQSCPHKG